MCGATEDEQPIHLFQSAQLDLAERADLFQPPKSLFDQPSAAQADGIAGLPRGSPVQVAAAPFIVLRDVRGHIQFSHRAQEVLRVVSLVGANGNMASAIT